MECLIVITGSPCDCILRPDPTGKYWVPVLRRCGFLKGVADWRAPAGFGHEEHDLYKLATSIFIETQRAPAGWHCSIKPCAVMGSCLFFCCRGLLLACLFAAVGCFWLAYLLLWAADGLLFLLLWSVSGLLFAAICCWSTREIVEGSTCVRMHGGGVP